MTLSRTYNAHSCIARKCRSASAGRQEEQLQAFFKRCFDPVMFAKHP